MADCMFLKFFCFGLGLNSSLLLLDPSWSKMYCYVESKRDCLLCEFFMVDSNLLVKLTDWLFFLKKSQSVQATLQRIIQSNANNCYWTTMVLWVVFVRLIEGRSIFFLFIYILILFLFVFVDRKLPCKDDFMPYWCNYGHGLWMYLTSWRSW